MERLSQPSPSGLDRARIPGPTSPVGSDRARHRERERALAAFTSGKINTLVATDVAARGIDVDVAWGGGRSIVATGNSFAAPHVAGMAAVLLAKHPGLTPFQVKAVLQAVSENALSAS